MYDNGQGVPQNYAEAMEWYRKAADQGNKNAIKNIARIEKEKEEEKKFTSSLDAIIRQDAAGWIMNRYDAGSVRNIQVTKRKGKAVEMRADYTFNNGQSGWINVDFRKRIPCLEYWDTEGICRPLNISRTSLLAAAMAANQRNQPSASISSTNTNTFQPINIMEHVLIHKLMIGD
jgi:TPR repeat protein